MSNDGNQNNDFNDLFRSCAAVKIFVVGSCSDANFHAITIMNFD